MNILFCNIAWMTDYQGITSVDKPKNGGSWVKENGLANEATNFKNYSGKYYGAVQVAGNINFKSGTKNSAYVDDVLVVWCATSEQVGNVIVGWYKHARVYRE